MLENIYKCCKQQIFETEVYFIMKKIGIVYIVLASALWGTSRIFVNYLAPYGITSLQMTFVSAFIAFICMGIYVLGNRKPGGY